MIIHCEFSSLFYWANGLTPVQHHNASLLTMIKTLRCHVCNTVPGCEVFLFMLANDAHVGAISLITTTVKTLVGPSPLHCPSHSTTPGEWVLVGWRLDCVSIRGNWRMDPTHAFLLSVFPMKNTLHAKAMAVLNRSLLLFCFSFFFILQIKKHKQKRYNRWYLYFPIHVQWPRFRLILKL